MSLPRVIKSFIAYLVPVHKMIMLLCRQPPRAMSPNIYDLCLFCCPVLILKMLFKVHLNHDYLSKITVGYTHECNQGVLLSWYNIMLTYCLCCVLGNWLPFLACLANWSTNIDSDVNIVWSHLEYLSFSILEHITVIRHSINLCYINTAHNRV